MKAKALIRKLRKHGVEFIKGRGLVLIQMNDPAMKLAIYQGMRDQSITQATLGECIGVDGRQIRRILDLDHNTSLSQLVRALKCLGKELVIDIRNAA